MNKEKKAISNTRELCSNIQIKFCADDALGDMIIVGRNAYADSLSIIYFLLVYNSGHSESMRITWPHTPRGASQMHT